MKIAQINSVCGYSSTGRTTQDLAVQIKEQGISSRVFYGLRDTTYSDAVKFTNTFEVKMHVLKTRLLGKHAFYSKLATKRLVKMLKAYQPNVIRLGQVHGHYINVPILFDYFAQSGIPVIWTLHDCWAMTGHCAHFAVAECEKWETGCYRCPQLREYPVSLIFDRSKESWQDKRKYFQRPKNITIVCPSHWVANCAKKSFLNVHDIKTIYNGVNISIFNSKSKNEFRKKYEIEENTFLILGFAGKWFNKINKGIAHDIITQLPKDCCLMLIGLNENQRFKYGNKVIALPYINEVKKLAEIYQSADVLINLSREDSFSKVSAESIASGTPVIGFDSTAIPEIIGECGIALPLDAVAGDFLNAVKVIKGMNSREIEAKCFKRAQKLFDDRKNYQQYINLMLSKVTQ